MQKTKLLILIFFILIFNSIELKAAQYWQEISIPNAKCGDGSDYKVFLRKKDESKLLVEFMGGGVCWDQKSCFERLSIFPWLRQYPNLKSYSIFTNDNSRHNIFSHHSKLYFPYCTGDVHSGNHIAHYNKRVYHFGGRNVELAIAYLANKNLIEFSKINDLVVYGASAGAIASLVHGKKIGELISVNSSKVMLVDSPGLHFGKNFWKKFSSSMINDFDNYFSKASVYIDFRDGMVSKKMVPFFDDHQDWSIGFIYGLQDYVMSNVFGELTPKEQKRNILSQDGLPEIAKNNSNVKFWLKDTPMHTFLLSKFSGMLENSEGVSVIEFVNRLYKESIVINHIPQ